MCVTHIHTPYFKKEKTSNGDVYTHEKCVLCNWGCAYCKYVMADIFPDCQRYTGCVSPIGDVANSKHPLLTSRKCNCACALPAEVQLRLRDTRRSWQKLFVGKNFAKSLVTAQTQLRSYSEQQRAFGNSNICNCIAENFLGVNEVITMFVTYGNGNKKPGSNNEF